MNNPLPFNRSFSTLGCPDADWEELTGICRRFDIRHMEIRCLNGVLDLPAYFSGRFGAPANLAAATEDSGIRICGLSTSLKLVGSKPEDREAMLRFLPWAEAVGGVPLRVFDGGSVEIALDGEALAEALDTVAWWRRERERNGWHSDIIVETHDAMVRSETVCRLQSALPQPVALLWDTHHTWKKGGEDPAITWKQIRSWVRHVHVKDSISQPSDRHPYTYVLPGKGEFPLTTTLKTLRDAAFDGVVSLEWEKLWHPYLGDVSEALETLDHCYAGIRD